MAVVSPSSPVASFVPRRFARGVAFLESKGFKVRVMPHARARAGHVAAPAAACARELMEAFRDPAVGMLLCTVGGFNSNRLLEHLDFGDIARHPKILMGYSDITALLNGIHARTGLVTFQGPALLPQFGEFGGMLEPAWRSFEAVVMRGEAPLGIRPSATWTDEMTRWDEADNRPRVMKPNPGHRVVRSGRAEGRLVGGNIQTLLTLLGTPHWPGVGGRILFLEEDEAETPATVHRMLSQLRAMGAFREAAAVLLGRFHSAVAFTPQDSLEAMLEEVLDGVGIPVLSGMDFGHTDPLITLPLGCMARVDTGADPQVVLLEPAVA